MFEADFELPNIFPDETVYSWSARYHKLSAHHAEYLTSNILFGNTSSALRLDIPNRLNQFGHNTKQVLGSPLQLLLNHTNLKFHIPFLDKVLFNTVIDNLLITENNSRARGLLGLNKFPGNLLHTLKICQNCKKAQLSEHHFNYWITEHQFASSFFCSNHQMPLDTYLVPFYRGYVDRLYLPSQAQRDLKEIALDISTLELSLRKVSNWGYWLSTQKNLHLDQSKLRWCYLYKCTELNLVSFDGAARTIQLRDKFVKYYGSDFLSIFGQELLGDLFDVNCGFISSLVRGSKASKHPLKHILMLNLLFTSPEEFESILSRVIEDLTLGGDVACFNRITINQHKLKEAVRLGIPISRVAVDFNTNITSAIKYIDKKQISRPKKPRIKGTNLEQQLVQLIESGIDRKSICMSLGIKASFLRDYLSNHQKLKELWSSQQQIKLIERHRDDFRKILNDNQGRSVRGLLRIPGNGIQWLRKHDPAWLEGNLKALWNL